MFIKHFFMILAGTIFSYQAKAQINKFPEENPVELGKVAWSRNFDSAINESKNRKLPILILFQEVPGCSNCTNFGRTILSHPLIVEIIETSFIPLCIHNNKGGHDQTVLKIFNEPSWNNPVIRIVDNLGKDIVNRQPDFRSKVKFLSTIIEGIKNSGRAIPRYAELLLNEFEAEENRSADVAFLGMYCFWSGEKEIAGFNGVLSTEAGYMYGKEVVKVTFDNYKTNLNEVAAQAKKVGCGDFVFASVQKNNPEYVKPLGTYRKDEEDKYYLRKSAYNIIPMTALQKSKVNRAIATRQNPDIFLSGRQLAVLTNKKNNKSQVDNMIEDVWWK